MNHFCCLLTRTKTKTTIPTIQRSILRIVLSNFASSSSFFFFFFCKQRYHITRHLRTHTHTHTHTHSHKHIHYVHIVIIILDLAFTNDIATFRSNCHARDRLFIALESKILHRGGAQLERDWDGISTSERALRNKFLADSGLAKEENREA
jgi:hypothetical protein